MSDVTSIDPRFVDATAGGESIVVTGSGFTDVTQVWFGEVAATTFTVDSDTQITAVTPAQNLTASSTVPVEVEGPAGRSMPGPVESAYLTLGLAPEPAQEWAGALPTVTSIEPTFVDGTGGGDSITITGSGFSAPVQVWFGSEAAASLSVDSDMQITAITPAQNMTASSKIAVLVDAAGGRSEPGPVDSAYLTLGVAPESAPAGVLPTVTSIEPTFVDGTGGGDSITITGSGFSAPVQVWFGSEAAASLSVDSDTQITAITPVQNMTASSKIAVLVDAAGGRSEPGPVDSAYLTLGVAPESAPAGVLPTVTSIEPTFVDGTGGGDSITITGSGFSAPVQVWFGSEAAASLSVDSDTQITAITPAQNMTASSKIAVLVDAAGGRSHPGPVESAYLTLGNPPA